MDLRKIKKLIEMLQESDLNEIEVKEGEESVRINRKKDNVVHTSTAPTAVPTDVAHNKVQLSNEIETDEDSSYLTKITSPMVGTFYKSASPDADPYVKVGDSVDEGTVICIIEAMKVMNQIKADKSGVIQRILVDDATPVEFGQGLFVIA